MLLRDTCPLAGNLELEDVGHTVGHTLSFSIDNWEAAKEMLIAEEKIRSVNWI
jgi:hypothetical protein